MNKLAIRAATAPTGAVMAPEALTAGQQQQLCGWLPPTAPLGDAMERAVYWRNLVRAAEAFGPQMIAEMRAAGALGAGESPIAALRRLLRRGGH